MSDVPTRQLNEEVTIPVFGLGTWQLKDDTCVESVAAALDIGYRHIDTADYYDNHQAVAKGIQNAGVDREDIFITSKLWRDSLAEGDVRPTCKRILQELDTDYLDLLLIHWPNKEVPVAETLEAMQELKEEGLIRAIGVSNFTVDLLEEALDTDIDVTNNQVEFHPTLNQKRLKSFCDEHGLAVTAYSPLGKGRDLQLDLIQQISKKHERSAAQVILNWLMQKGLVVIPRSKNPDHIEDNFGALEWELDTEDMRAIDGIGRFERLINPDFVDFQTE